MWSTSVALIFDRTQAALSARQDLRDLCTADDLSLALDLSWKWKHVLGCLLQPLGLCRVEKTSQSFVKGRFYKDGTMAKRK